MNTYTHATSGLQMRIHRVEHGLRPSQTDHSAHRTATIFRLGEKEGSIEFVYQADGRVAALVLYQEDSAMPALRRR